MSLETAAVLSGALSGAALLALRPPPRAGPVLRRAPAGVGRWLQGTAARLPRRSSGAAATRTAVVDLAEALAAHLRAGRPPQEALLRAGAEGVRGPLAPALASVLESVRLGGDAAAALRCAARTPGAQALAWLAAAWEVTERHGAGLAVAVDRVAAAGRADDAHRRRVAAQLAGPRATARTLAVLPVVGLLLGAVLGAAPLHVLLTTPVGWGCLVLGGLLDLAGVGWTRRLVSSAESAG